MLPRGEVLPTAVSGQDRGEHPTQRWTVYVAGVDGEVDDTSLERACDEHYPVTAQGDRFKTKEVHAPQAVGGEIPLTLPHGARTGHHTLEAGETFALN